ncbi:MAG: DUF1294 domain-containing protein [Clostridiales bacterium]|nr:MAG: DUF1294 domain-containing protein [Clostridiales bacterium]
MDLKFIFLYFAAISVVAAVMALADKFFAVRGKRRLSEKSLLCVAALGGAVSMFTCMLIIRHKTKHIKFMAGLPIIIILQSLFITFVLLFLHRIKGV